MGASTPGFDHSALEKSRDGDDLEFRLRERVKELTCLYEVASTFVEYRGSPAECARRIVAILPAACRYPERAGAGVRLDDLRTWSTACAETACGARLSSPIVVAGVARGEIVLVYGDRHALPGAGEAPTVVDSNPLPNEGADTPGFLPEERSLLETVAREFGVYLESVESEARRRRMEAQLRHADRLAAIGQLAAGVAHELNEPLASALGFAQLALKAPELPEHVRADLGRIVQAALHGREITRKLLVFARQAETSTVRVDLNAAIEEAMFLLEAGCENPAIRFVRALDADLPTIEADPVQMRQVVTNLVINAMQAIDGAGTITIGSHRDGDHVTLTVEDDGAGMTAEVRRRAFDPFFTTKDVGDGTGLGLAVVQGIVTAHGGTVEVHSAPRRGSTFLVRLPRRAAANE